MTTITINGQQVQATRIDELNQTVLHSRNHVVPAMADGLTVKLSLEQVLGLLIRGDLAGKLFAADAAFDPGSAGPLSADNVQAALDEIASTYVSSGAQIFTAGEKALARANIGAIGNLRDEPVVTTSTGTYVPDAEVKALLVEIQGAGGGGGGGNSTSGSNSGAGGGGAAGTWTLAYVPSPSSTSVTIGAGGSAGTAGANAGGNGGVSSFGSITAPGGNGGGAGTGTTVGFNDAGFNVSGGANGDVTVIGAPGGMGIMLSASECMGGQGGSSRFGPGGRSRGAGNTGLAGQGYGSGGAGGSAIGGTPRAGGAGGRE